MTKYLNEWSTTAGSNNSTQPDGWPEGITSDKINNIGREQMAVLARWEKDNNGSVVTTGTQPVYVATLNQTSIAAYYDGMRLCVDIHSTNASATAPTINVNAIGAKALVWPDGTAVETNALVAGMKADLIYDGTNFQVIGQSGNTVRESSVNTFTATQIWSKGADVASADPLVLGTDGNYFDVTGTTTIASVTVSAGTLFMLQFDGILTLTHHATNLNLPGAADITTAAGDRLIAFATAANTVEVMSYVRADGTPVARLSGSIVQIVNVQDGALATGTTVMPYDDTIPQITEGDQYMSLAITPTNSSNKLIIQVEAEVTNTSVSGPTVTVALFQDATAGALAAVSYFQHIANAITPIGLTHYMAAGTTSATTFRVRVGAESAGTTTFNGAASLRKLGGVSASSITITEVMV